MKKVLKQIFEKFGIEIKRVSSKMVTLKPNKKNKGYVLISYIIQPFLTKNGEDISNSHTHHWESFQIAKTFLDFGYTIDIVHFNDNKFKPKKNYSFFVGARTNFQRITKLLNEDCVKIVHLDMAHWIYNNCAGYKRCLELQKRRGVALESNKMQEVNWAIEHAQYVTILGNKFTIDTYKYIKKPIYRIPISTTFTYSWPKEKDFKAIRKNFLWFGGSGLVHKGLDLVLEAFAQMPEYSLTVCGPIDKENNFRIVFYKELYETANIHTVGWIDASSSEFIEIANQCVGLIYPSCSEGGGEAL